jgi:hypothetical protein
MMSKICLLKEYVLRGIIHPRFLFNFLNLRSGKAKWCQVVTIRSMQRKRGKLLEEVILRENFVMINHLPINQTATPTTFWTRDRINLGR